MIENICIDANSIGACIALQQTTKYLVIRNCMVTRSGYSNFWGKDTAGIWLWNCQNVKIEDCTALNNDYNGIKLKNSDDCFVDGCTVDGVERGGIEIKDSQNIHVTNNVITNGFFGIMFWGSSGHMTGNDASSCVIGIEFNGYSSGTPVSGNTASSCTVGMNIFQTSSITFSENHLIGNDVGINVFVAFSNTIEYNELRNNRVGIAKQHSGSNTISNNILIVDDVTVDGTYGIPDPNSFNTTIENNTIIGYKVGILLNDANQTLVKDNTMIDNGIGLLIENSNYSVIVGNLFENNTNYGIKTNRSSTNNSIFANIFMNNNNGSIQAFDDVGTNYWQDENGTGNYWSDYEARYPDASSDGEIWSIPYVIDGGLNVADGGPKVYPVDDPILAILNELSSILNEIDELVSLNLVKGRKIACEELLHLGKKVLDNVVEDYLNTGDISEHELCMIKVFLRCISIISKNQEISDCCTTGIDLIESIQF
ncbi:MAG: nitrous oxide reductase family maturation protein NosD [Candidatus Hodarchaeota archaeon]